jgi:hypothetical protein
MAAGADDAGGADATVSGAMVYAEIGTSAARLVGPVAQDVIRAFLFSPLRPSCHEDNTPVRERALFIDHMWSRFPARLLEQGNDKFSAGIRLGEHCLTL